MPRLARSVPALLAAAVIGCSDAPTEPALSLVGSWAVVAFVDYGVPADVEGTAVFTAHGTYTFDITMLRFPGQASDSFTASGTWTTSAADRVTLHGEGGFSVTYRLVRDDDRVIMSLIGRQAATTITLRATAP